MTNLTENFDFNFFFSIFSELKLLREESEGNISSLMKRFLNLKYDIIHFGIKCSQKNVKISIICKFFFTTGDSNHGNTDEVKVTGKKICVSILKKKID